MATKTTTHFLQIQADRQPVKTDSGVNGLIARCLAGNEAAYGLLYHQFSDAIFRLNMSLLNDEQDAEEVLQDAFEYAFRKLGRFDASKSAFKTWLYTIAISRCRNKRRRKWLPSISIDALGRASDHFVDEKVTPPEVVIRLNDARREVWDALAALSPKLREVTVLRYYEALPYKEIGAILKINPRTAESRMRLAHKVLRKKLATEMSDE